MNRRLKELGFTPILAYIVILTCFFAASIYLFRKTGFAEYLYVLTSLAIMARLCGGRRIEFLKTTFTKQQFIKIRILENMAVSIPFLIFLVYKEAYLTSLVLVVLSIVMVFFNTRKSAVPAVPSPFFRRSSEFTIGFRRIFFAFPLIYGLALIAAWADNFNLGLFAMSTIFLISMNFFQYLEHEYFIWSHALRPKYFLLLKIKTAVLHSTLLVAPVLLLLGSLFYERAALIAVFLVMGYAFLICVILAKYSSYPRELSVPGGILIGMCLLFPPMLLALIPYFFIQSARRLTPLLK